ncbi:DUF4136 domain-containing protein [Marinirhabdus gelatinilytica]|uniref:Uncharacterized protein DUF4136 n=1 Tax=Marinirhabdus gelatinilytica TaxID=1703343 RepID=A0A370Q7F5_9FLAO|nr:DUF4136 domain-containing protein [Marinirhabdus gelatinilytica]RDK84259.1 uncharacterized protein DUF4136 [Marinirhabdus gelatinilytica]
MKLLSVLLGSLLLLSCGATVGVDYDETTNFSQYNTYNFYPTIASGLNDLDDKRVMQLTDSLMQQRGFIKSETPQLYINFYAKESVSNSRNTIGIGVGGGGGNVGVGVSGGIPIGGRVVNQQFTMDFIDVLKDDLVWQAVADADYKEKASPAQKEAHYLAVIEKILKKYPPKE